MRRTIRGGRPYFFADPAIDKILNMVVVLGGEVWTLRERLAALEAIQVRQGSLAAGEVDAHDFSPEDETQLAALRKEFIDSLFRVLQEQVEEAKTRGRVAKVAPARAEAPRTATGRKGQVQKKPARQSKSVKMPARRGTSMARERRTKR
jgi:hypothetical protein